MNEDEDTRDGISQRLQGLENRQDRMHERLLDELYALKEKQKGLEKKIIALEKLRSQ